MHKMSKPGPSPFTPPKAPVPPPAAPAPTLPAYGYQISATAHGRVAGDSYYKASDASGGGGGGGAVDQWATFPAVQNVDMSGNTLVLTTGGDGKLFRDVGANVTVLSDPAQVNLQAQYAVVGDTSASGANGRVDVISQQKSGAALFGLYNFDPVNFNSQLALYPINKGTLGSTAVFTADCVKAEMTVPKPTHFGETIDLQGGAVILDGSSNDLFISGAKAIKNGAINPDVNGLTVNRGSVLTLQNTDGVTASAYLQTNSITDAGAGYTQLPAFASVTGTFPNTIDGPFWTAQKVSANVGTTDPVAVTFTGGNAPFAAGGLYAVTAYAAGASPYAWLSATLYWDPNSADAVATGTQATDLALSISGTTLTFTPTGNWVSNYLRVVFSRLA